MRVTKNLRPVSSTKDLVSKNPKWITSYCLGQQKKEKFGMQFFPRFEPGFSALVFHGVSFTHGGCFISGCHVQLHFAPAPSHDSWLMKILIPPARPIVGKKPYSCLCTAVLRFTCLRPGKYSS